MRITDGNIFEGMRLVLPEHREAMEEMQAERKRRRPPELSEDELSEMQYALTEAIKQRRVVRLTLFDPVQDEVLEGVLEWRGGRLSVQTVDGRRVSLDVQRLIRVDSCS
jgi:hypothetical protein